MTDNPRSTLLQQARRHTATIVIGTLAGTGVLTVGIAATAAAGAHAGDDPTSDTTEPAAPVGRLRRLRRRGDDDSGDDGERLGRRAAIGSSTRARASSDGGTHSS